MASRASLWFFGNFFYILLVLVCLSQWVTLWWLLDGSATWPWWSHPLGIIGFWLLNARLARGAGRFGRKPPVPGLATRIYFGTAFASVFCFAFLVAASALRLAIAGIESALFAHAPTIATAPSDDGFVALTRLGIGFIGLSFVYGYTIGQRRLRVRNFDIPVANLPDALNGLRIAHITDIHMGQNLDPEQLEHYVARVNAERPDLICVTGDMIDSARTDMNLFLPIFAGLRAPCGVVAILGNHDHSAGAERVVEAMRRLTAITLLRDEHLALPIHGSELHVIGLDDRGIDWARGLPRDKKLDTLFERVPAGAPTVLLNHRPDLFPHAAELGIHLMLAGHTHGGQIAMPWITGRYLNPSRIITPFDRGLYEQNGSHLYTNCGLGVTAQRVRICTPREIAVFRLHKA